MVVQMNEWEILGWFERFNEGVVFSVPFVRSHFSLHFYRCYYFFSAFRPHLLFAPFKRQISVYYLKDDVNTHSFIYFFSVVVGGGGDGAVEKRLIVREFDGGRRFSWCVVSVVELVVSFIVRWSSLGALRGHIYRQTYLHGQNKKWKKNQLMFYHWITRIE